MAEEGRRTHGWSEEHAATMRRMWAKGFSAAEIGIVIGKTRNAVIGRVHRENLPRRDRLIRKPAAKRRREAPGLEKPRRPILAGKRMRPAPPTARLPLPPPLNITLLAIRRGECRRMVGEPAGADSLFCGRPTGGPKRSYCPACARRLYLAPKTRRGERP